MMPLTKASAYRIEAMESAGLIWYKHHIPWADDLIRSLPQPPSWLVDLAVAKYVGDVQKVLRDFVFSEPFESMDEGQYYRDYIASFLLRYQRRDLSWASFLVEAGQLTDRLEFGKHPCEYFFEMLNEYQDSDFSRSLETEQVSVVTKEFDQAVQDIMPLYLEFRQFYPKGDSYRMPS